MRRVVALVMMAQMAGAGVVVSQSVGVETTVAIVGTRFVVNGSPVYEGSAAEGLLLNSRMINAAFDDQNAATRDNWVYRDTGVWDPERNLNEFIAAVPTYAAYGLAAVTIGMQGGRPAGASGEPQPWHVSAFRADGSLKAEWLSRLDRAIRACDANGLVVILNYFYFGQDQRLTDEAAVIRATDNATDWVMAQGYRNVLIEISNEADNVYDHAILRGDRVHELVQRVQARSNGRLKASSSMNGGSLPKDTLLAAADFVLLHGNGQTASSIRNMVATLRSRSAYKAHPKPIVFNEDSTTLANFEAAIGEQAGWGLYDRTGFQVVPINWTVNTPAKQAFFTRVAAYAPLGPLPPPPPPPSGQRVTGFVLIDAESDVELGPLVNGQVVHLSPAINVVAQTSPSIVGSVVFRVNGQVVATENGAPYALAGNSGPDYLPWDIGAGSVTVTATPYQEPGGSGVAGQASTIQLVLSAAPSPSPSPSPSPPPPPPPVDCVVSTWSVWQATGAWSTCSADALQAGTEQRSRSVLTPPSGGGGSCPALVDTRSVTRACTPGAPAPAEICGDDLDNDGDGAIDEDCGRAVAPPGAPRRLSRQVRGSTVQLGWRSPLSGGTPTGYLVEAGTAAGTTALTLPVGETLVHVPNVGPGRYYVRVRAVNSAGAGPPSNEVTVSVGCSGPPRSPSTLTAAVNGRLVALSWVDEDGCNDTSYVLAVGSASGSTDITQVSVPTDTLAATAPPGTYYARVHSASSQGVSGPSNEMRVAVGSGPCTPPMFGTNLQVQLTGRHVTLAWGPTSEVAAAAADDVSPISYVLQVGTAPGAANIGTFAMGRTGFTTAAPPGTYYLRVRPADACGPGAASNEVVVRVQ